MKIIGLTCQKRFHFIQSEDLRLIQNMRASRTLDSTLNWEWEIGKEKEDHC